MTTEDSRGMPESGWLGLLRAAALIAAVAGAAGSLGLMFRAGHRQKSIVLMGLFTTWVLSPFVGILWATMVSKRRSVVTRATLHIASLILTLGSLAIYANDVLRPSRLKPAFVFLMVPLGSWVLLALGTIVFLLRAKSQKEWPFGTAVERR